MATDAFKFGETSFKFEGFKELYQTLTKLPEGLLAKELTPLLVNSVEPLRVYAQNRAPDDPATANPDLESSIIASPRQRSGRAKRDRALGRFDARVFVGPAGSRAAYPQAIMQEFGTVKMSASPFMRPAFDAQKETVVQLLQKRFGDHLEKIAVKYRVLP